MRQLQFGTWRRMYRNVYDIHFGVARYAPILNRGTISIRISVDTSHPFHCARDIS